MSTQVKDITLRARPDILALKPYSSARSLYGEGEGFAFLDANECPFAPFPGGEGLNRYPEQQPGALIGALRGLYDVSSRNMVACRGADEAIDVLIRAFCASGADNIIVTPPTFVMYRQAAALQGAEVRQAPLRPADFSLDPALVERCADENTKIVFLCSPNNPTGNLMEEAAMLSLCAVFEGRALVVVDETYIEYAARDILVRRLDEYGNLVILRTLSKAYAAAGIRCGVAIAAAPVIDLMKKVLAPYPLPRPVVSAAVRILTPENRKRIEQKRAQLLASRDALRQRLSALPEIEKIYPSDANFLLVKTADAAAFTEKCVAAGVIARSQSHVPGLENCVRLSIGTDEEMERLMAALAGVAGAADRRGKSERVSSVSRVTKETAVSVAVDLDRENPVSISTGVGFYDHMLEQIARHGGFSLTLECAGDLHIDPHHTIEDCAIALGQALREALGAKQGIGRYGFTVPMDEAQASCVLDLGGRFYLDFAPRFPESRVGGMPTDMVRHVFYSLAENLGANLHMEVRGENTHHMVEGCFKAFGRALRQAIRREGEALPSTKGVL